MYGRSGNISLLIPQLLIGRIVKVRNATSDLLPRLADIWFEGWQSGHAQHVPRELTELRTRESFLLRLETYLVKIRVISSENEQALGFHIIKDDEIYQFYVSAQSRGQGIAAVLIADAEQQLRRAGVRTAWLACAIGNDRAARFYEKSGWHRAAARTENVETSNGTFPLQIWQYEKEVS